MNPASIPNNKGNNMAYIYHLLSMQELVKKNLKTSQERMKKYADLKQKNAPEYRVGDLVMLDGRNIQIRRPKDKLDHKQHGPFAIENIVLPTAMQLSLPRKWKIHNTYHISILEPYNNGTRLLPDLLKIIDESDNIKGNEEYDIKEILSSRNIKGKVLY
jgi:hypothetical protein